MFSLSCSGKKIKLRKRKEKKEKENAKQLRVAYSLDTEMGTPGSNQ
jgi:hypothetical protein